MIKKEMKDYQPPTSSPTSESLPRVQRIRNIPIERIPSPNNNINNISENNITATTTILPKKLNEEDRFRIHSNQVERKILPGAAFLPKIQQHHSNHRHHGIATTPTLADHHNHHHHHRRFDGYRENQQHPLNNHSQQQHPQQYYNLRTTPFGESLRHRTNTPGSYSNSYEHQQHQPSAAAGISLVAQYGVGQDTGHSTASTPSASRPKLFPGNSNRGGSLPTSHSINLPNHSYNYRIQMPSRQSQHSSPIPPHPHQHQHRHHSNHQHHIHDSDDILPEIEASGFPQDPIIEAERQEPDYHLVESGSDILLSTKDDVPAPAPTGPSTTNQTAKNKIFLETDIVDSSCDSDEDDDVVKNCDIEDGGNTRGMNRKF